MQMAKLVQNDELSGALDSPGSDGTWASKLSVFYYLVEGCARGARKNMLIRSTLILEHEKPMIIFPEKFAIEYSARRSPCDSLINFIFFSSSEGPVRHPGAELMTLL